MRRHPNRFTPKEYATNAVYSPRRQKMFLGDTPKRGPKNKAKRWPLLNYTIEAGFGVIFHELP